MCYVDDIMEMVRALDEQSQAHVLSYARFLYNEDAMDVYLYDKAKAEDDGYRISLEDLKVEYGL